jgi:hypothetical protein
MNRSFGMKNKFLVHGMVAIAMTCGVLLTEARADSEPIVHEAGGVSYVSEGVSEESRQRLSAYAGRFNLKLVFAMTSGAYLGDVRVAVADAKGKTLLETTAEGPWFLAKLPVGNYRVVASYAGKALKRSVAVDATRLRTVDFRWGDE